MDEEYKLGVTSLFTTPFYHVTFDGLSDELNLEALAREEISNNRLPSDLENQIEQSYPELHLRKEIRPLCDKIVHVVNRISKEILFFNKEYKVEITAMWANIQKPYVQFIRHKHRNNMFAGVFYVTGGDYFPPIIFFNPIDPQLKPSTSQYNQFNGLSYTQPTTKDTLIIFPAYLDHSVEMNKSDEDRISISFNIMLRGEYDRRETLQMTSL